MWELAPNGLENYSKKQGMYRRDWPESMIKGMLLIVDSFRENAPCIVFIDEIDAVGGKRKTGGSTSDYSRMTINQLLQEMDGFKSNDDVIVIGATNLKGMCS